MKRFIQISSITRLVGFQACQDKRFLREWVYKGLATDARLKAWVAAGRVGLS